MGLINNLASHMGSGHQYYDRPQLIDTVLSINNTLFKACVLAWQLLQCHKFYTKNAVVTITQYARLLRLEAATSGVCYIS